VLEILRGAFKGFGRDDCATRAAALSYYTVFAMPSLLILLVTIAGKIWDPVQVQRGLEGQVALIIGQPATQEVHQMIEHGAASIGHGLFATVAGAVGLVLGAVGALLSLQDALNHAWEVKPAAQGGGIVAFIVKRLLSLGMVLGLGLLLALSLAVSAAIASFASFAGTIAGQGAAALLFVANLVTSLGVLTVLFAALFKFLPDTDVAWRDVWVGGLVTALLFIAGESVLGLYLGHSRPGDVFGAASALAVILVWIYYSGLILLFGAELTRELAVWRSGVRNAAG
jgi:membrane protein